jgi:hypothetical protein
MKKSYTKKTNCGTLTINMSYDKQGWFKMNAQMEKFGECSAYKYVSDSISEGLLLDLVNKVEKLRQYKCKKGSKGCITVIGKCLEDFFGFYK